MSSAATHNDNGQHFDHDDLVDHDDDDPEPADVLL